MITLNMKIRVHALIGYDPEVKSYHAHCPELPGCTSCGDTESEALRQFEEALKLYFEPKRVKVTKHIPVWHSTVTITTSVPARKFVIEIWWAGESSN